MCTDTSVGGITFATLWCFSSCRPLCYCFFFAPFTTFTAFALQGNYCFAGVTSADCEYQLKHPAPWPSLHLDIFILSFPEHVLPANVFSR